LPRTRPVTSPAASSPCSTALRSSACSRCKARPASTSQNLPCTRPASNWLLSRNVHPRPANKPDPGPGHTSPVAKTPNPVPGSGPFLCIVELNCGAGGTRTHTLRFLRPAPPAVGLRPLLIFEPTRECRSLRVAVRAEQAKILLPVVEPVPVDVAH